MKPKIWRQTEQNGVNVWRPNASIWMQAGLLDQTGNFPASFTVQIIHHIVCIIVTSAILFIAKLPVGYCRILSGSVTRHISL